MALLIWNLWGLGLGARKKELAHIVNERKINIFGIMETRIQSEVITNARRGFEDWGIIANARSEPESNDAKDFI